ncbi:MAG: glutathione S-transferase family protein [Pseudolabrys sp.]|nr:glutathione S-transferase family protein [Pseudolabrys sp.]MBV9261962.1 glutathione S-transferase family protein [Pseudolabrys sp.]
MPQPIVLFSFGPGFGLPELSPFCTKTEVQLKMAELPYRKEKAMPDMSPKGQLPFIEDQGERIADSHFIRAYIERKYGVDLDDGLSAGERAEAWAIERMLENHFLHSAAYERWMIPANFERGPAHFFDALPEDLRQKKREEVKNRVANRLFEVGMARHTPPEIAELGERSLMALSALLGDRPYLMGEKVSGVDAAAFAMLAMVLSPFFDSKLRAKAETFPNLVDYTTRMMTRFFPQHAWGKVSAAA